MFSQSQIYTNNKRFCQHGHDLSYLQLLPQASAINNQLHSFKYNQWRTQEFFSGGVQQIQLRTEDREDGDPEAVAP